MRHHTKDKGDQGLGFILSRLLRAGVQVALPISEHLPFDCIAISEDGQLSRLSVKYRAARRTGVLEVRLRSTWADRHGSHVRHHTKSEYDGLAIYCPDTGECYFLKISEIDGGGVALRVLDPKKGGRQKTIRWAKDYRDPLRLFVPIV